MAKVPGTASLYTLNSVALENDLDSLDMAVAAVLPEVTSFTEADETFVEGPKGTTYGIGGNFNGASAKNDATLFARFGAGAATGVFKPGGAVTGYPIYTQLQLLKDYKISSSPKGAVKISATLQGTGANTRTAVP